MSHPPKDAQSAGDETEQAILARSARAEKLDGAGMWLLIAGLIIMIGCLVPPWPYASIGGAVVMVIGSILMLIASHRKSRADEDYLDWYYS